MFAFILYAHLFRVTSPVKLSCIKCGFLGRNYLDERCRCEKKKASKCASHCADAKMHVHTMHRILPETTHIAPLHMYSLKMYRLRSYM